MEGFPAPKFKKFKTRAEADSFVGGGEGKSVRSGTSFAANGVSSSTESVRPVAGTKRRTSERKERKRTKRKAEAVETTGGDGLSAAIARGARVIDVYTDGASSSNGRHNARAGWGVHWPDGADPKSDLHNLDESARLPGELQTNNRAELMAIIRAIQLCPDPDAQLRIYTDSKYCIMAMTVWQHSWRKNKWRRGTGKAMSDVLNRDLIRLLDQEMRRCKYLPILIYVKGHGSSVGNNEADRLAVAGATLPDVPREEWREMEPPPSECESDMSDEAHRKKARTLWEKAGFRSSEAEKRAGSGSGV